MDVYHIIDCGFYSFYIKESVLNTYSINNKKLNINIINNNIINFKKNYKCYIKKSMSSYNLFNNIENLINTQNRLCNINLN